MSSGTMTSSTGAATSHTSGGDTGPSIMGGTSTSEGSTAETSTSADVSTDETSDAEGAEETVAAEVSSGEGHDDSSSGGETPLGPQLVRSVPSDGERSASLQSHFLLYFDRVVSPSDATGHIFVAQADGDPVPVAPLQCPPDYDPTCIAAVYPASFRDAQTDRLPGNTRHRIIVDGDFPDPDGITNAEDQTVEFNTLDFTANVFDDSAVIDQELGGLALDRATESLFLFGSTAAQSCLVRRVPLRGGVLGSATTVATPITEETGQDVCYGVASYDGALYVALTYEEQVIRYEDLTLGELSRAQTIFGPETGLADPDDTLDEVWSMAAHEDRVFLSFGNFHTGLSSHAILEASGGDFSIFNDGGNLWAAGESVVLAAGMADGEPHLFAFDGDEIHKFRIGDGILVDSREVDPQHTAQLFVDAHDRVFFGHDSGLAVYGATDLEPIGTWEGFAASRFAVVASESSAVVYGGRYRSPAVIGRVVLEF